MLPITDGVVTLRTPDLADRELLIAGRDEEHRRWLGPGSSDPQPTACILVGTALVGWVDADPDPCWLPHGGVNIGYSLFGASRGQGFATRAVRLLLSHLAEEQLAKLAIAAIDPNNARSIAVVRRAGFVDVDRPDLGLGRIFEFGFAPLERPVNDRPNGS
jgi:ribosomal protein S18 acetylase RimI-like enzyme